MAKKATKKIVSLSPADVAGLLCSTPIEGWAMEHGVGYLDMDGELWTKDGHGDNAKPIVTAFAKFSKTVGDLRVTIALNVRPSSTEKFSKTWDEKHAFSGVQVEGHTGYNGRTFTRRGVDVSSCTLQDAPGDYEHTYGNLVALLDGEWKRCEAAHARSLTMVDVPGVPGGWRVTPERKAQIAASLKAGKDATFMPSGFGTGYRVFATAPRKLRHAFGAKVLPPSTAEFFGVSGALYYETLDCD